MVDVGQGYDPGISLQRLSERLTRRRGKPKAQARFVRAVNISDNRCIQAVLTRCSALGSHAAYHPIKLALMGQRTHPIACASLPRCSGLRASAEKRAAHLCTFKLNTAFSGCELKNAWKHTEPLGEVYIESCVV